MRACLSCDPVSRQEKRCRKGVAEPLIAVMLDRVLGLFLEPYVAEFMSDREATSCCTGVCLDGNDATPRMLLQPTVANHGSYNYLIHIHVACERMDIHRGAANVKLGTNGRGGRLGRCEDGIHHPAASLRN